MVSLFAVLLLLATKRIDGYDLRGCWRGGIKFLAIVALFISLVNIVLCVMLALTGPSNGQDYLAVSLDAGGLFIFFAFWITNNRGSSGKRLRLCF